MKTIKETYNRETYEVTKTIVEPVIGQTVTVSFHSDRRVYDIIAISASTKKLTIRERTPILVENPEFAIGGFGGNVTKQAVWKTESNENGGIETLNWSDKKQNYFLYKNCLARLDSDSYFYDYNF